MSFSFRSKKARMAALMQSDTDSGLSSKAKTVETNAQSKPPGNKVTSSLLVESGVQSDQNRPSVSKSYGNKVTHPLLAEPNPHLVVSRVQPHQNKPVAEPKNSVITPVHNFNVQPENRPAIGSNVQHFTASTELEKEPLNRPYGVTNKPNPPLTSFDDPNTQSNKMPSQKTHPVFGVFAPAKNTSTTPNLNTQEKSSSHLSSQSSPATMLVSKTGTVPPTSLPFTSTIPQPTVKTHTSISKPLLIASDVLSDSQGHNDPRLSNPSGLLHRHHASATSTPSFSAQVDKPPGKSTQSFSSRGGKNSAMPTPPLSSHGLQNSVRSAPSCEKQQATPSPTPFSSRFQATNESNCGTQQDNSNRDDSDQENEESGQDGPENLSSSARDWQSRIKVNKDEKVLVVDANGNQKWVGGQIRPRDVFQQKDVRYFVNFNEFKQPIGKGGKVLVNLLSYLSKMERYCPIGEITWHDVNDSLKADIISLVRVKFVIPNGDIYDKKALRRVDKYWREYKHDLKTKKYNPDQRSLVDIYNDVPDGHPRNSWMKLVDYWHSSKGQDLSAKGKAARAQQDLKHTTGSTSFANVREDFKRKNKRFPSNLELFDLTHITKDGVFLDGSMSKKFMDEANAKVKEQLATCPSKSRMDVENDVYDTLMYGEDDPKRPVGYGFGVKKSEIFGVQGELRKRGYHGVDSSLASFLLTKHNQQLNRRNEVLESMINKSNQRIDQSNQLLLKVLNAVSSGQVTQQFVEATRQSVLRMMNTQDQDTSSDYDNHLSNSGSRDDVGKSREGIHSPSNSLTTHYDDM